MSVCVPQRSTKVGPTALTSAIPAAAGVAVDGMLITHIRRFEPDVVLLAHIDKYPKCLNESDKVRFLESNVTI